MLNCFHSEPVAAIYKRRTPLGLLHKVSEEVGFIWKVQTLNTSFRDNAAVIGLPPIKLEILQDGTSVFRLTPIIESSCFEILGWEALSE